MEKERSSLLPPAAVGHFIERLSDLQWDYEVARVIPKEWWARERDLYDKKFWDYRRIHPAKATAMFAMSYGVAYRFNYLRGTGDLLNEMEPFKTQSWSPFEETPQRAKAFWKGRVVADEFGMDYLRYCFDAFEIAGDNRLRPRLLLPRDMYASDIALRVGERAEDVANSGVMYWPSDAMYEIRYNYEGLECQDQWETALVKHIRSKPRPIRPIVLDQCRNYLREETALLLGSE